MLLNWGVGENSWEFLGLQGDPTSPSERRSVLGVHWKDWCWSWNCNILPSWCEELTHWKRPWCWERLRAGGEGDDRGWNGRMASPTQWTWVWVDSRSWWWTGRPGMLQFMGSQRVGHDWVTELNWTEPPVWSFTTLNSTDILTTNWLRPSQYFRYHFSHCITAFSIFLKRSLWLTHRPYYALFEHVTCQLFNPHNDLMKDTLLLPLLYR